MVIYTCVWCGDSPVRTDPRGYCEQCAEYRRYISQMMIYIWPNGSWIYEWEVHGFTMEHSTILEGGHWVNLDKLSGEYLSVNDKVAILEALGE